MRDGLDSRPLGLSLFCNPPHLNTCRAMADAVFSLPGMAILSESKATKDALTMPKAALSIFVVEEMKFITYEEALTAAERLFSLRNQPVTVMVARFSRKHLREAKLVSRSRKAS